MSPFTDLPPLSLYVHLPWCVRKCPYCDFNSHAAKGLLPEDAYVTTLLQELDDHSDYIQNRPFKSIFIGGGTPSLFSGSAINNLLVGIKSRVLLDEEVEITLEANPGTIDQARFEEFFLAGINRLSIGVQSFQNDKLKALGRIHDNQHAVKAIQLAKEVGFQKFNIDLMYGLPNQSIQDALYDLETALAFSPPHLSWYQLTLEPNTPFYLDPPKLPSDDYLWEMQLAGQTLLNQAGLKQYEISAYALPRKKCVHNLNYWEFGDYLGIGAGAHSKITLKKTKNIIRFLQVKHPKAYLSPHKQKPFVTTLNKGDLIFEFMLNALRLTNGVPLNLFPERTGLSLDAISETVTQAKFEGLLMEDSTYLCPSNRGFQFLNHLTTLFLP